MTDNNDRISSIEIAGRLGAIEATQVAILSDLREMKSNCPACRNTTAQHTQNLVNMESSVRDLWRAVNAIQARSWAIFGGICMAIIGAAVSIIQTFVR